MGWYGHSGFEAKEQRIQNLWKAGLRDPAHIAKETGLPKEDVAGYITEAIKAGKLR